MEINGRKLKILHVVGSPTDEFRFRLNVLYGSAFQEDLGAGKYEFTYMLVRPGGLCSFVERLADVMDSETLEEKLTDVKKIDITDALQKIKTDVKPDMALLHLFCEKGTTIYRALFEALEIPLIGPAAHHCFTVVDKLKTRKMILGDDNNKNVHCPEAVVYKNGDSLDIEHFPYPCVVKASKGEDSMAVRLAKDPDSLPSALKHALSYSDTVIIERFIKGREIRCAVIESRARETLWALIPQEYKVRENDIRTAEDKLSLDKRGLPLCKAPSTRTWFLDSKTDEELIHRIQMSSFDAFLALDLRDFATFDFRVDSEGKPWFLECNLFCSFGPQSVLNIHATHAGITDEVLFDMMIQNALLRGKST